MMRITVCTLDLLCQVGGLLRCPRRQGCGPLLGAAAAGLVYGRRSVKHWGTRRIARHLRTCRVSQGQSRTCSTFFWNARFMRLSGSRGMRRLTSRLPLLGQPDQCRLAATVSRMLQQREQFLQGGGA
jgi:hypothetical protein